MMNFTTLISPLLTLASAMNPSNLNQGGKLSASTLAALDRSLGTIASLGLSLSLYRVLVKFRDEYAETTTAAASNNASSSSTTARKNIWGFSTIISVRSLVHVLIRNIMMGLGIKRIKDVDCRDGREDGTHQLKLGGENPIRMFHGSCHCKSISFMLRAPSHIEAKDCNGKIKYPHYISDANDFQLTNGNQYLSVYYVDTSKPDQLRNPYFKSYESKQSQIAAHTFCSRCGVHILRAPDSHTNKLEVNVNCLDDFNDDNSPDEELISIRVAVVENSKDGIGSLGEGRPVYFDKRRKQAQQPRTTGTSHHANNNESRQGSYEDSQSVSSFNSYNNSSTIDIMSYQQQYDMSHRAEIQQPWHVDSIYKHNEYKENATKWRQSDGMSHLSTPATLNSTLNANSCESDETDTVGALSRDENHLSPNPYAVRRDENDGISGWPMAPSIQSITPRNQDFNLLPPTAIPYGKGANSSKPRPSSMMKDQLKYYMKKHMTPPSTA